MRIFLVIFTVIITTREEFVATLAESAGKERRLDYDMAMINMPIRTAPEIALTAEFMGEKLHLQSTPEYVKGARAGDKDWLQVSSHPVIIRLDVQQLTRDELIQLKIDICTHLSQKGHVCFPSPDDKVRVVE